MRAMRRFLPIFFAALILLGAVLIHEAGECKVGKLDVTIATKDGNLTFTAKVADTAAERAKGLMGRTSLAQNEGMLFVFDNETILKFWMKDTLLPLDIIFISADMTVADVQTMEPCTADPCPLYASRAPAQFALEVNAGAAKKVSAGDGIFIDPAK